MQTWIVVRFPRTPQAETVTCSFGTLKAARIAVERGLDRWLPSVLAAEHARGEHTSHSPYGCRACDDESWARRHAALGLLAKA